MGLDQVAVTDGLDRVGDPVGAEKDLGFNWTVDLEDGLRRLIDWRSAHKEAVAQRKAKVGG